MRALIRARIEGNIPLRSQRDDYNNKILDLFEEMGFSCRMGNIVNAQSQSDLSNDSRVIAVFEEVPGHIRDEEMNHIVMVGYVSDGQSLFIVSSINTRLLHIRVRNHLINRLQSSCGQICQQASATSTWGPKWLPLRLKKNPRIIIENVIDISEPGQDSPTIKGDLGVRPFFKLIDNHPAALALLGASFLFSFMLFWNAPDWAPIVTRLLSHWKTFDTAYIQGLMERIYSALMVTVFITGLDLTVKYRELCRRRPITWMTRF